MTSAACESKVACCTQQALPKDLGGQAEMIPTQEAVAQMRADSKGSPPANQQPARPASGGGQQASRPSAATSSSAGM